MCNVIDWNKPVRVKGSNFPVKVVSTTIRGTFPILVVIDKGSRDEVFMCKEDGTYFSTHLENIPEEVWICIYKSDLPGSNISYRQIFSSQRDAVNWGYKINGFSHTVKISK